MVAEFAQRIGGSADARRDLRSEDLERTPTKETR